MGLVGMLITVLPAMAQTQDAPGHDAPAGGWSAIARSPVVLGAEHWAVHAAARAEALGLATDYLPARAEVPRDLVWTALQEAATRAAAGSVEGPLALLTAGWVARFREEFPEYRADRPTRALPALLGSRIEGGFVLARGRAGPGRAEFPPDRTGAEPLADITRLVARSDLAVGLGRNFAIEAGLQAAPDSTVVHRLALSARAGAFVLSAGREAVGYATGVSGGVVLASGIPVDGMQLESWRPVRGPGFLRVLGPMTFDAFFGQIPTDRHPGDPYIWGARGSFQPHPRMTFAVQRAALFGGDGSERPITFSNVLNMLLGRVVGVSFEDQVVSASGRFRLPTEGVLPLMLYAEVGSEDAAGSFWQVPGMMIGLESAAIPGAPWLAVGLEGSGFAHSCCGNPPWYRHFAFPGAWALDDRPLGNRLGGQGTEFALHARADLLESRVRASGELFRRGRAGENLYLPGREGSSLGGGALVTWRLTPKSELEAAGRLENGRDWREGSLRFSTRWIF